jgi:hypothetical protein
VEGFAEELEDLSADEVLGLVEGLRVRLRHRALSVC